VLVAPPDRHLVVDRGRVRVVHGPRENRHRPSVDVLFRSAAHAYGPRVVAVVLTGTLDDGAAGLVAVKKRGGLAVVQDPADAEFPGMPQSAMANVQPDHVVPVTELGVLLQRVVQERLSGGPAAHDDETRKAEVESGAPGPVPRPADPHMMAELPDAGITEESTS
jgi:two-component system chemotaxis response regulator CheB